MRGVIWKVVTVAAIVLSAASAAWADDIEVGEVRLEQTEDALVLNAEFRFDFNARLEQAVVNGVPLYFVVEFELTRPRWYWFDEKTATRRLQTRLSYHALSRHYRLSTGMLQQNFATLAEALAVLRRVRNWPVLDKPSLPADANYEAAVRMRLDLALLPKPFQVSALTSREWRLESDWKRFAFRPTQALPPLPAAPPAPSLPAERQEEHVPR